MSDSQPLVIRSHSNPTVRRLIRLRSNRTRRREKRLLVDGWRETRQAIDAGLELIGWFTCESTDSSVGADLPTSTRHLVSHSVMEKIAFGQSARGIVAEFSEPIRSLETLDLSENALVLVLDCLEKPGNIGAVFRSADAAGVEAVVLCGDGSDLYNPNAIRNSLGTVFRIPSATGSEKEVQHFLVSRGIRTIAARVESSQPLWHADLSGPLAIIMGSESKGLGDRWQSVAGQPIPGVRVPMFGEVDSLNVSVSAAVMLYEARRQRESRGD
ncbi:TrmH family RNA methyltransferase [Novipirellula artificiosorum]|uniref:23S rRNA (Guanosine-2'-O-)-methyltransferase RlmB n=1 Tax=Novipirellula artificiosorum TaxID=2528016 RepID=A0A5C6DNQ4_9BACT|nr:TrmH family RNA methyltransferase [Novipirellula artificiosorum]TWU37291.1 23S rRNA (guanosine-2'-O-)-methyltransferase RlmB [Novipirellula artificiosorum]